MDLDKLKNLGLRPVNDVISRADDQYLADLEALRERPLPPSYRHFLVEIGPSWFEESIQFRPLAPPPWAGDGPLEFAVLCGKSGESFSDVLKSSLDRDESFPKRALVLGHDSFGNLFFLGQDDAVYFVDRETNEAFLCARDFDGFLDSLQLAYPYRTGPVQGRLSRWFAALSEHYGTGVAMRRAMFFALALALAAVLALAIIDLQARASMP